MTKNWKIWTKEINQTQCLNNNFLWAKRICRRNTYGHLVLDTSDIEQRLDLLPQLPPRPGAELEVFPQVSLDDLEGQALLLELLVVFTRQVTSDVSLHPRYDLAETFITKFLHLTQDSSTEEYLFFRRLKENETLKYRSSRWSFEIMYLDYQSHVMINNSIYIL